MLNAAASVRSTTIKCFFSIRSAFGKLIALKINPFLIVAKILESEARCVSARNLSHKRKLTQMLTSIHHFDVYRDTDHCEQWVKDCGLRYVTRMPEEVTLCQRLR